DDGPEMHDRGAAPDRVAKRRLLPEIPGGELDMVTQSRRETRRGARPAHQRAHRVPLREKRTRHGAPDEPRCAGYENGCHGMVLAARFPTRTSDLGSTRMFRYAWLASGQLHLSRLMRARMRAAAAPYQSRRKS